MRYLARIAPVLAVLFLAAPPLHAQTSFAVSAGAAVPLGDLADGYDLGYNVTGSLGIKPPLAPIGVRIDAMLNSLEPKAGSGTLRVIAGTVNATLSGAGMPIPMGYLIGGLGMYNTKVDVTGAEGSTDFGINIGAGINFPLTGFSTFLEARFHHVMSEGDSMQFLPITFGLRF